jgi:hypothetical protein
VQRVQRLIAELGLPNAEDRNHDADVLGSIGPPAKAAVPSLEEALEDENPQVSASAAKAIGRIGEQNLAVILVLIGAMIEKLVLMDAGAAITTLLRPLGGASLGWGRKAMDVAGALPDSNEREPRHHMSRVLEAMNNSTRKIDKVPPRCVEYLPADLDGQSPFEDAERLVLAVMHMRPRALRWAWLAPLGSSDISPGNVADEGVIN